MLGLCIPHKELNSTCNSDIECNDSQKLSCINEKCACRAGFSLNKNGLCRLAYGEECSKENICSD